MFSQVQTLLAAERETVVVLTAPGHERDTQSLVERLGVPVFTPLPDSAQDLMEKYGITAEQAGDGSPDLVWLLRENKGEARPYSPDERLPSESRRFPDDGSRTTWCSGSRARPRSSRATRSRTSAKVSRSRFTGSARA